MQLIPAYVSWNAFLRAVESLAPKAPERVSPGSFGDLPASTASQIAQTFRFLGLITSSGEVTPDLRLLVEQPESSKAVLSKVVRQSYPEAFAQGGKHLTAERIKELISRSRLRPATERKALTFLVNAATYLGWTIEGDISTAGMDSGIARKRASLPEPLAQSKRSLSIQLRSGGLVEICVDIDPLRLDKQDREFLFDLIDRVQAYRSSRQAEERQSQSEDEAPF